MVKIKLMRTGRTGIPFYRVVAVEAKTKRDGKYIEKLGLYNPAASPKIIEIDLEKYDAWLKKGAQPTDTVASLAKKLKAQGSKSPQASKKPAETSTTTQASKAPQKPQPSKTTTK